MLWVILAVIGVFGGAAGYWLSRNFREEIRSIVGLIGGMVDLLWLVWCWVYTIRWRLRFQLQNGFFQTASGLLLAGSFYIFLELGIIVVRSVVNHSSKEDLPQDPGMVAKGLALLPDVPVPPLWSDVALVVMAALVFRHHWREWNLRKREVAAPGDLAELVVTCRQYLKAANPLSAQERADFFSKAMAEVAKLLSVGRKKRTIAISLTTESGAPPGLSVVHVHPTNTDRIDKDVKLSLEHSAAGKAYLMRVPIYVPSTRHLGGINMKTYRTVGLVYDKNAKVDPGPSLMCVPVMKDAVVKGVINVSSNRRNDFGPVDFDIVGLAAALMAEEDW